MLESFSELRTRNLDAVKAAWRVRGLDGRFDLPDRSAGSPFILNAARFEDADLCFIRHDRPITLGFEPSKEYHLGYQLRATSELILDGRPIENSVSEPGRIAHGDRPWGVRNPNGFQVLLLNAPVTTLSRKLTAYLGCDAGRPELRQPSETDPARAGRLRSMIMDLAIELESADKRAAPKIAANVIDAIYIELFEALSERVLADGATAAPSPVQVGRVEQYLVAHFDRPLTLEVMAEVAGVSARSVIQYFLGRYGCTPQDYLERVRVQIAHARLAACGDRRSLALVAQQSGFATIERFEKAYRRVFGDLPRPGRTASSRRRNS